MYLILKVGGLGLIPKDIFKGELLHAINEVYHGKYYFGHHYKKHFYFNKICCFIYRIQKEQF